jgi:hypothetical protein
VIAPSKLNGRTVTTIAGNRAVARAFHDRIAQEYLERAAEHLRAAAALEQPAPKPTRKGQ